MATSLVQTSSALNIYVEADGDDDAGTGAEEAPFATLAAAIDSIRSRAALLAHGVNIYMGAGNFAGAMISGFMIVSGPGSTGYLKIHGTLREVTPTSGSATGTFTSGTAQSGATHATGTKTGAGWTTDDFKGKVCEVVAGTGEGTRAIIRSNTSEVLSFVGTLTVDATSEFRILEFATTIDTAISSSGSAEDDVETNHAGLIFQGNLAPANPTFRQGSESFIVADLKIATTGSSIEVNNAGSAGVVVSCCELSSSGNWQIHSMDDVRVSRSYLRYDWDGSQLNCDHIRAGETAAGKAVTISIFDTFFDGGKRGILTYAAQSLTVEDCAFYNVKYTFAVNGAFGGTWVQRSRFDGNDIAGGSLVAISATYFAQGAKGWGGNDNYVANYEKVFDIDGLSQVVLAGTWTGDGNGTLFELTKGARCQVSSTFALEGDTEISLDGTTYTLTNMRAASPKLFSSTYFTIIYE